MICSLVEHTLCGDNLVDLADKLERLYQVFPWPEDLSLVRTKQRLDEAYKIFQDLLEHSWFKELLKEKDIVRVLDICGGVGIGGIALAKALMEKGLRVELVVNDLRGSALAKAREYAKQILGIEIATLREDALRLYEHDIRVDIALMYGISAPHFNPYQMVQLAAGVAWILKPNGLFLVDEFDRVYGLLCRVGCKDITIEHAGEDRILLTLNGGYNSRTGMFKRVFLDIPAMTRVEMEYRMWDIAGVAAILWMFFEDVDFKPTKTQLHGILIARKPRGINPRNYVNQPTIAKT